MTVNNIDSSILDILSSQYTTTDVTESTDSNGMMSMDNFLTVFLAQLQYQDPLNPMEGTEMTTQLSSIASVEQLYNANEKLDILSEKLDNISSANPLDYLGKDVLIDESEISVLDGEISNGITFTVEEDAAVEITIYDSGGSTVRQMHYDSAETGSHMVAWDAKDDQGITVDDGTYYYEIQAFDEYGVEVEVQSQSQWRVTGITYEAGTPYLLSGDIPLDPANISRVYDPSDTL